jgi:hypothetical protein
MAREHDDAARKPAWMAGWTAALGVAAILVAGLVAAAATWGVLDPWGRAAVVLAVAAAFFVLAHLVYRTTPLRRTGLALLLVANLVLLADFYYACVVADLASWVTADGVATLVAVVALALAVVWYALLREAAFLYMGAGAFVLLANAGIAWTLAALGWSAAPGASESPLAAVESWMLLGANAVIAAVVAAAGFGWPGHGDDGRSRVAPVVAVAAIVALVTFPPDAARTLSWWGWVSLAVSVAVLWYGLTHERTVVTISAIAGVAVSVVRLEGAFFTGVLAQSVSLVAIGVVLTVLAFLAARTRRLAVPREEGE